MSYKRDKEQKIEDIKKSYTELINRQGYEKTTIRQIATKAENSVGIIYHYFPHGKPSIAAAIYEDNIRQITALYECGTESDRIDKILKNHLVSHRENFELYRAFDQAILADSDVFESVKKKRRDILLEYALDQGFSVESVSNWLRIYNVIDALIHRHLYIEKVCDSETEFLDLLNSVFKSIDKV